MPSGSHARGLPRLGRRNPLRLQPDADHGDGLQLPPLRVDVLLVDVSLQLLGRAGAVPAVLADVVPDLVVLHTDVLLQGAVVGRSELALVALKDSRSSSRVVTPPSYYSSTRYLLDSTYMVRLDVEVDSVHV